MPLKVTRVEVTRVKHEETLAVPKRWSMFSSKGNKRLAQLAQKAHDAVDKLCADGSPRGSEVRKVLLQYLVDWVKLWRTKTYGEASDTSVRECVGDFHDNLWYAAGMSGEAPWDEHYDEAQSLVRG